jgi:3-phenylpropionate/cinnamic acid dioxygenase small subunit
VTEAVDREVRQDVAEVLVRYATSIDRRDWVLFRTCFTDDCEADYGGIGMWHNADEMTAWMRETHEPCGHTMHRITNEVVTMRGGGDPGGESVAARSYVDAIVLFGDNQSGTRATGFYDDELVATSDGWKIAKRRFTLVMVQLYPEGTKLEV